MSEEDQVRSGEGLDYGNDSGEWRGRELKDRINQVCQMDRKSGLKVKMTDVFFRLDAWESISNLRINVALSLEDEQDPERKLSHLCS